MTQQPWKYEKEENKIALPTIGRVVYYYHPGVRKEMAAIVADVGDLPSPYTINLGVLNHDGTGGPAVSVPHMSELSTAELANRPYWDWMPFQKGQAAKTEQLQAQLEAKSNPGYASGQGAAGAMPIDGGPYKK